MIRTLVIVATISAGVVAQSTGPSIFAGGIISRPESHDDYISLSPDGRTAVFTRLDAGYRGGTLYLADLVNGTWSNVRVAPFSGTHQDSRASFSPDGRRIVFASNRPSAERVTRTDLDLWQVWTTTQGWSEPVNLGAPINSTAHETHPSLAASGALYFVRRTQDSDIWMAPATGRTWSEPVRLPEGVNSARPDSHVWVDPAERFLLFAREVPSNGDDVFVSIRRGSTWSPAEALGPPVNTPHYDYSAKVFNRTLYFTRNGQWSTGGPADIMQMPAVLVPALAPFYR